MTTFADLGVPADLIEALDRKGITSPFPVQQLTIADALKGLDVCGKAPTGSGKTLAFGIPLVARVKKAGSRRPTALVLAPTRELAAQIHKELEPMAKVRGARLVSLYGGVGYERQRSALRRGVEIVVACPGRLRDLLDQKALFLDKVEVVVIDEADRMADMGFLPAVRGLLDETSADRQTVLFSATLDGDVGVLQRQYQHPDTTTYEVDDPRENADIDHRFEHIDRGDRLERTASLVREHGPTMVFTRTRHGADRLARQLQQHGVEAAAIHGGLSQSKRDRSLQQFKSYKVEALVATDVAARGIHVDAVACVVHFDPPEDAKAYVHRSGRTARAGATGTVVSLVAPDQVADVERMKHEVGLSDGPAPTGTPSGARRGRPSNGRRPHRGQKRPAHRSGSNSSKGAAKSSSKGAKAQRSPR